MKSLFLIVLLSKNKMYFHDKKQYIFIYMYSSSVMNVQLPVGFAAEMIFFMKVKEWKRRIHLTCSTNPNPLIQRCLCQCNLQATNSSVLQQPVAHSHFLHLQSRVLQPIQEDQVIPCSWAHPLAAGISNLWLRCGTGMALRGMFLKWDTIGASYLCMLKMELVLLF